MQISTIGLDLAKRVFQIDGADAAEQVVAPRKPQHAEAVPVEGLRPGSQALYDSRRETCGGSNGLASVRFAWSPVLVNLRREICPAAQWQKKGRQWIMNDSDAEAFVRAAQARLDFQRSQAQIRVNDVTWVVGFVRGAPYRLSPVTAQ